MSWETTLYIDAEINAIFPLWSSIG